MNMTGKLVGAYKFEQMIGEGTFSIVWECTDVRTNDRVACKVISLEHLSSSDFLPHFKNELIIHSQVVHPSITKLLDLRMDNKNIYVVMELCEGGSLNDIVDKREGIDEDEARTYFRDIMCAIEYIHRYDIAHRDIKLENILVTRDKCAKLTDFGLCKQVKDNFFVTCCGTLIYAAPEIIQESPYRGLPCDIWSAGVLLYTMVAGHFPWVVEGSHDPDGNPEDDPDAAERLVAETVRQITDGNIEYPFDFSPELHELLVNMLNVNPEERLTAADIIASPWLRCDPADIPEEDVVNTGLVEQVKQLITDLERMAKQLSK